MCIICSTLFFFLVCVCVCVGVCVLPTLGDIQYVDKEYVDKTYVDKDQRASDPALALALALALATQPHIVLMRAHNPVYVPRNHRVNAALVALEKQKDCTLVRELLDCLRTPFKRQGRFADLEISPSQAERVARTYCGT